MYEVGGDADVVRRCARASSSFTDDKLVAEHFLAPHPMALRDVVQRGRTLTLGLLQRLLDAHWSRPAVGDAEPLARTRMLVFSNFFLIS